MKLAMLVCAAVALAAPAARGDAPKPNALVSPDGRLSWWAHRDDPHVMLLFERTPDGRDHCIGVLDPEAGSWRWAYDARPLDMVRACTGKPRDGRPTGDLPPAKPRVKAGIEETSDPPAPRPTAGEKLVGDRTDCKCGGGCECKRGRVADGCKCAVVAGDVVDGSPRGGPDYRTGGVDLGKLRTQPRYAIGGKEVGAAEAMSALGGGAAGVPDDAGHVRITVIGPEQARKRVVQDLDRAPELAWLKGRTVVNDYAPDYWRIADGGFATAADPGDVMIYAQAPDGRVLWRQEGYQGPAVLAGALRDKVPGYDPSRDPRPHGPDPPGGWTPAWVAVPAVVVFVFVALAASGGLFLWRHHKANAR